jgi:1-acyl-sn-glycerol-3-phosphate acyltransferase
MRRAARAKRFMVLFLQPIGALVTITKPAPNETVVVVSNHIALALATVILYIVRLPQLV